MRVALTVLAACLVAGCGAAGPRGTPTPSNPGLLVFGGVVVPVPEPPELSTPWHQPISYYALGPDGTGLRKLAFTAEDWELDFSPGGGFAVMLGDSIIVSRPDGSERRVVPLPKNAIVDAPAVSADGKTVALAYAGNPDASPMDLWTVSVDGSHLKRLATTGNVMSIAWSPDGKHIAFVDGSQLENSSSGAIADIYVVDADGSDLRRLARGFTVSAVRSNGRRTAPASPFRTQGSESRSSTRKVGCRRSWARKGSRPPGRPTARVLHSFASRTAAGTPLADDRGS